MARRRTQDGEYRDGSLTLYVQKDSAGAGRESNWLPAPDGPIYLVMRLYWPKQPALDSEWKPPPNQRRTRLMTMRWTALTLFAVVAVSTGCATQSQMLAQRQDGAVQTALQRGRFDLNCPSATATVLSSDFIQPAVQGPWVGGMERVEYTVGVAGCNQRTSYVVLCQVGTDTCFAAQPRDRFGAQGQ